MSPPRILVVAGEASGDRLAALAARSLRARGAEIYGVGGPACASAGVEVIADGTAMAAMGLGDAIERLPAIASSLARIVRRVRADRPRAALLVNFTELNQRLGRLLGAIGVRVLWCVAPQVWAWRAGRMRSLRGAVDRLAVILPFEEPLWRKAGFDARYVGHPAAEIDRSSRSEARALLGLPERGRALAVLPGSRPGEIARLGRDLSAAARRLLDEGSIDAARLILAPALTPSARALAVACAEDAGIAVADVDAAHGAASILGAFDASLCASGTASLEAALAGASPVVAYRLGRLSHAIARRLVTTPHIALPNVLLGARVYPELVQDEATAPRLAEAARSVLAAPRASSELHRLLHLDDGLCFGERVAFAMRDWVSFE